MRVLVITTMRNEAPFVLEWIAYHQHIGVTDFLIYSNDCADGTDLLLDRLEARGIISHVRNHAGGKKTVQWRALSKARNHVLAQNADWVYVADVDEFLCIHAGGGHLHDLMAAAPDAEGFAIPWRMFGNNGVQAFEDAPILGQFTRAAPERLLWPWRAVQFKSLYRNDPRYDRLGVHKPRIREREKAGHWVDGNGAAMPAVPGTVALTTGDRYALAQINHYAVGAMDSFLVKSARGKPNHSSDPIDLAYWADRNFNDMEDKRILRHLPAVEERLADLRSDAETARLHDAGVAWRKAKIAELMRQSDSFYLMARLQQMPPTKVLPMQMQRQLLRQLGVVRKLQAERRARAEEDKPL
ncbi:glycosyltransferase family 2 protein [Yoonia sp. BS5-3]|uniref:Glycosyltransferase family 2 protein n=1 Tax=Yoonia phaeophyticola TaxID=3137369 RepID=A0ABZ2V1I3_9RHOB